MGRNNVWTKAGRFGLALGLGMLHGAPSPAHAAVTIGGTENVVSEVHGLLGEINRVLEVADDVFQEEVIDTGSDGATRIAFIDGTQLTMGPNSRVTLDRFVYDPAGGDSSMVVGFVAGIFEFASGLIPSGGYELRTPFANLTIRGTRLRIMVLADGLQVTAPEGEVEVYMGAFSVDLEDPLTCLVWAGGAPELRPVDEACATLGGAAPTYLDAVVDVREMPDAVTVEEVIQTGPSGGTRLVFPDGSELVMGADSQVILERYAFDAASGEGELRARFGDGAFEFSSGQIPSANYELRSAFSNLELQGTRVGAEIRNGGKKLIVSEGKARAYSNPVSITLNDSSSCVRVFAGQAGLYPIPDACQMLVTNFTVTAGLLGLGLGAIEPGGPGVAPPVPNPFPAPTTDRAGFVSPASVSPTTSAPTVP
jgi:hypothetical protein